jgi:TRAP-type C4-dicarboxylate transport system substrate-binding protein
MFAALGAEPVVLPNTRTRTALATGLIDAAENNWPSYVASDHYSVAPYFALTEHTMTPDVLIMSMKAWFLSKKARCVDRSRPARS